jgi:hypothetical protein
MSTIDEIQTAVASIEPSIPMERVVVARDMLAVMIARLKEMKRQADDATIEWIEANGPIEVGEFRTIAVAYENETTCVDVPGAVEAIATERGFAALCDCLSTNAMKHGAARKTLPPEEYDRLFKTRKKPVIKDGKAGKALVVLNTMYLPKKGGTGNILDEPLPNFELT